MNILKRFVSGLGQQTAPFGFAPDDPDASYKAGLGYIGDLGASLLANNQGGVNPWANLGASMQQAKQSSVTRNKEAYTAQRLMEEAAAKKAERERAEAEREQRNQWLRSISDPQMRATLEANPQLIEEYVMATNPAFQKPEKPTFMEVNGKIVNPMTGEVVFDGGSTSNVKWKTVTLDDGVYAIDESDPTNRMKLGEAKKGDTRSSPTELKELWKSEDEIPILDNTIDSLQTALALNDKTFTGYTASLRGDIGTKAPGVAGYVGIDQEAAKATSEFNKIMTLEAVKAMAETLKGATTDQELARFVDILADPAADPDIRKKTIVRMLSLAEKVRQNKVRRVEELRGNRTPPPMVGTVPDGVTEEEWNAMTDEERAAWQ